MNKKPYVKPTMEIVDMESETALLAGSSGEENPWWKEPEPKEGCETPWWCP